MWCCRCPAYVAVGPPRQLCLSTRPVWDITGHDSERDRLKLSLAKVTDNPYSSYTHFEEQISRLAESDAVVERFRRLFSNSNLKKTFVAEGFLLLYAKLMQQEPIGYLNVNDGDIFQDIHPMQRLAQTQSQKALDTIYFHKDLANHFVRPDWVNILGLRANPANRILTSFVKNEDLLEALPSKTKDILRQEVFHTPYDDLTNSSENKKMGDAPNHRILGGATDYDIRFFENRTMGLTDEARKAVSDVLATLHRLKKPFLILKGDFIGSANNECVHNKEVAWIGDLDAQKNRWLMKTVNVRSLGDHRQHMVDGRVRIVNG
ncbi:hypothetical protein B0T25DRAFT_627850 [Lasiosphaeria hispida]|uniref:TauD/TfdA-like domain-containing protein n=1 Tax=Lasiosphaeria hispida TaxID=260671 RepID=A0AAJ0HWE2_9PEZI|nr:hypothetical protein B0T25DRAFT_627850 [Lasiosphaeria hispida]